MKLPSLNLNWDVIYTGAIVGATLGLLMKYTNIFRANAVYKAYPTVVQTDVSNINNAITSWLQAHSIDPDTARAHEQAIRNQTQTHRIKIQEIIAKFKAGQLTKDEFRSSLRQEAKAISDELNIGLRPTGGTSTHQQLASSLVPLKQKLRDDIIAEANARIHRTS